MQINKYVHAVKIPFYVLTPLGIPLERMVYVYMIYGTQAVHLIDSGVASSEEIIFDYLRKTDRKVEDISRIIQTHSHPDHIGASRTIKGETGCIVAVHPLERAWIENVKLQAEERPVPGFDTLVSGSLAVDRLLEDEEVIGLGCGLKLKVFYTPGHSIGSVSIMLLGFNVLFSGDAIPVPGQMPVYEDVMASVSSIKKLMAIPDIQHLLPSWDEPCKGDEVYQHMEAGLRYIQQVHDAVRRCEKKEHASDQMELCRNVLEELGLPPEIANPLVARSIAAHQKIRSAQVI